MWWSDALTCSLWTLDAAFWHVEAMSERLQRYLLSPATLNASREGRRWRENQCCLSVKALWRRELLPSLLQRRLLKFLFQCACWFSHYGRPSCMLFQSERNSGVKATSVNPPSVSVPRLELRLAIGWDYSNSRFTSRGSRSTSPLSGAN